MFSLNIIFLGFALIGGVYTAADEYKIIDTKNGQVRGIRQTTLLNNIPFYSFKGIPFAKPPVGDLRFKVEFYFLQKDGVGLYNRYIFIFDFYYRPLSQSSHGHQTF